jgi:DNA-binding MarR family transcriptional regulator
MHGLCNRILLFGTENVNPDLYLEGLHGVAAAEMFRTAARELGGDAPFSRAVALFFLRQQGPQTISSLAGAVALSQAAASRMVDGMVKAGLLTRREHAADRRQKRVALTPAGEACIAAIRLATSEAYRRLFEGLPDELRERFAKTLEEVSAFVPSPK